MIIGKHPELLQPLEGGQQGSVTGEQGMWQQPGEAVAVEGGSMCPTLDICHEVLGMSGGADRTYVLARGLKQHCCIRCGPCVAMPHL
jgi:hypothetical protein